MLNTEAVCAGYGSKQVLRGVSVRVDAQEIVAFIVPRIGAGQGALDVAGLRAYCLRELGRYKTPKEFRFVAELPRGPSGKVQRLKLVPT